jgi:hypothetical protein
MRQRTTVRGGRRLATAGRRRFGVARIAAPVAVLVVAVGISGASAAAQDVGPKDIKKNAVRAKHIKKNQVKSKHIAKQAVKRGKIRDGAVSTDKIADQAVTTDKIADLAVETVKIAAQAVTTEKIADGAVDTAKIADLAVGTAKIADGAVGTVKLADGAVTAPKLGPANFTLGSNVSAPANAVSAATLNCPAGTRMLSGGPINTTSNGNLLVIGTHPNNPNQWRVQVRNLSGAAINYRIVVHCLLG